MKVINLFAGPGCGKSTTAAGLFYLMKCKNYRVELVTEYIKPMAYEGRKDVFKDQIYIFAKQQRRQHILRGKVDWVITDSPLLFSAFYASEFYYPSFLQLVLEVHNSYDNYNFLLNRTKEYFKYGRHQTLEEAKDIDQKMYIFLNQNKIHFKDVDGTEKAPEQLLKLLAKDKLL